MRLKNYKINKYEDIKDVFEEVDINGEEIPMENKEKETKEKANEENKEDKKGDTKKKKHKKKHK